LPSPRKAPLLHPRELHFPGICTSFFKGGRKLG
jgi:hypothetical protein